MLYERLIHMQARGVEGLRIRGDQMEQNHRLGILLQNRVFESKKIQGYGFRYPLFFYHIRRNQPCLNWRYKVEVPPLRVHKMG